MRVHRVSYIVPTLKCTNKLTTKLNSDGKEDVTFGTPNE